MEIVWTDFERKKPTCCVCVAAAVHPSLVLCSFSFGFGSGVPRGQPRSSGVAKTMEDMCCDCILVYMSSSGCFPSRERLPGPQV
jgi:hypothetical protein